MNVRKDFIVQDTADLLASEIIRIGLRLESHLGERYAYSIAQAGLKIKTNEDVLTSRKSSVGQMTRQSVD